MTREGEMWVEYEILAARPRQVATGTLARQPDPGLKAIIGRALTRFAVQHGFGTTRAVTDLVLDAEPVEPGLALYKVSVSYWPGKVEAQP